MAVARHQFPDLLQMEGQVRRGATNNLGVTYDMLVERGVFQGQIGIQALQAVILVLRSLSRFTSEASSPPYLAQLC